MKKSELKNILKPLVKECIKECLFEEGVLSGIIKEVTQGLSSNTVVESSRQQVEISDSRQKMAEEEYERQRQERIKRLNESASKQFGVNIFEGTQPAAPDTSGQGALSGVAAGDKGVDIDGIIGLAKGKWKQLI